MTFCGDKKCALLLYAVLLGLSSADDENHSNQTLDVFSLHPGPACHGVTKLTNIDQLSRSVLRMILLWHQFRSFDSPISSAQPISLCSSRVVWLAVGWLPLVRIRSI